MPFAVVFFIGTMLLTLVLHLAVIIVSARYYLHMLQLSSYQLQGYFRVLRQHRPGLYLLFAIAVCDILISLISDAADPGHIVFDARSMMLMIAIIILTVAAFLHFKPRQEKKPFVFTDRVKRLTAAVVVLILAAIVLQYVILIAAMKEVALLLRVAAGSVDTFPLFLYLLIPGFWCVFGITCFLVPFVIALAGVVMKPVEDGINNGFIRDAQRILQGMPRLRIIGVTGSFGKTSVKYYLTTVLSGQYNVLMTPESYNTPMGIVRTIRERMKPTHEIFVCEMGARHVHDIKEITDFVHPDDGILTAIGEQHLETFHSLDNIIATKYELLDAVEEKSGDRTSLKSPPLEGRVPLKGAGEVSLHGLKFINGDDPNIRAHMKYPDAITYGLNEGNDFRAINLAVTPEGTTFQVQLSQRVAKRLREEQGYVMKAPHQSPAGTAVYAPLRSAQNHRPPDGVRPGGGSRYTSDEGGSRYTSVGGIRQPDEMSPGMEFHTGLVGAHNVQNIMAAIAVATLYGVPASKIRKAVRRIEGVPHRLELKRHGSVTILDDAYNANPTGAATALETLAQFRDRVRILVTPGMVELGEKEEAYNEAFGAHAAACADYIILVGEKRCAPIRRGALGAGFSEERLFVRESFREASALMYELDAGKEKVILLENDLPDNY